MVQSLKKFYSDVITKTLIGRYIVHTCIHILLFINATAVGQNLIIIILWLSVLCIVVMKGAVVNSCSINPNVYYIIIDTTVTVLYLTVSGTNVRLPFLRFIIIFHISSGTDNIMRSSRRRIAVYSLL